MAVTPSSFSCLHSARVTSGLKWANAYFKAARRSFSTAVSKWIDLCSKQAGQLFLAFSSSSIATLSGMSS